MKGLPHERLLPFLHTHLPIFMTHSYQFHQYVSLPNIAWYAINIFNQKIPPFPLFFSHLFSSSFKLSHFLYIFNLLTEDIWSWSRDITPVYSPKFEEVNYCGSRHFSPLLVTNTRFTNFLGDAVGGAGWSLLMHPP